MVRRLRGGLRVAVRRAGVNAWCQFPEDEFLEDAGDGTLSNPNQRVLDKRTRTAIVFWSVKIGNAAFSEAADDPGVVRLHFLIIALGDHGIAKRVQKAGFCAAGSPVEIARILLQKRGQNGASD